jgi:5'-AMP-activated protein kinase, catalytic alpha subunit
MIMEYCNGGELFDYIVRHTRLSEKQACKFYLELISGIEYIHQSGVCHRDLKPENLLLDYDLTLKIVDFGLSNMYEAGASLKTACGSPCYAAPEMIAGKRYHGLKTDIWSSGVVFYAMVCGYLPFEDPKTSNLYKKIMGAEYTLPKFLSGQCKDMIRRILNTDPETRFSVAEIRNHTWSLQVKDRNRDMGLFPGKEKMPVEEKLFEKLLIEYNFDRKYAQKCIEDNRHNHITACYHLIDKRNRKIKDRQESYHQTKIDFKKKMRMGTKDSITVDPANQTTIVSDIRNSNNSPNPIIMPTGQKQDLNMTAPIHSEQVKNGRKMVGDFVSPNQSKTRDNSVDY